MTITTFQPLQARDVEIGMIDRSGFLITTTPEAYQVVRNCLTVLKEQEGLPVDFASETEGMKYAMFTKAFLGVIPDFITQDPNGLLPPRIENHFIIPGHRKVGSNVEKMKVLAEQVAQRLRSFQLRVEVNEDSSLKPKLDPETEFCYTVMTTSLAHEIAKVSKNDPLWEGIPPIIPIMLGTGEFLAIKELVENTPPVLQAINDGLLNSYVDKVANAISKSSSIKEEWSAENSRECIAKLGLEPPTKEAREILSILNTYHNS